MKIIISYMDGEEREVLIIQSFVNHLLAGSGISSSDRHPPFKHIQFDIQHLSGDGGQHDS